MATINVPTTCQTCGQHPIEGVLLTYWFDGTGPKNVEFVCGTCGAANEYSMADSDWDLYEDGEPIGGSGDSEYHPGKHLDMDWLNQYAHVFEEN